MATSSFLNHLVVDTDEKAELFLKLQEKNTHTVNKYPNLEKKIESKEEADQVKRAIIRLANRV